MQPMRLVVCAAAMLVSAATTARAQGFITPFIGYNFGGDSANCQSLTNCEEKRTNFGVSLGTMGGVFGFEADISYAKDFFGKVPGSDTSVLTAMGNLVIGAPLGPVQPYVLGGIGLIRPHASLNPASLSFDKNALGYDLGGGIHGFFSHNVGLRGDVRHFRTFQGLDVLFFSGETLHFWRASLGLTLRF